jgi:hypothetical protein
MLAGLSLGIVHDRRLMREAPVILAIRWLIGYGLHETTAPQKVLMTRGFSALLRELLRDPVGHHPSRAQCLT